MQARLACLFVALGPMLALTACKHDLTSPAPTLASVAPDLVCNGAAVSQPQGTTSVALAGSDFTPMPSHTLKDPRQLILPSVTLGRVAALPGGTMPAAPITIADDPANPSASRVHWTDESAMAFDVAPSDMLAPGVFDVTVTNPDHSHATTLSQHLGIIPPPIVTQATPMAICNDQSAQPISITGSNFLVYDGAAPKVTLDTPAGPKTYTATFAPSDCAPIPGTFAETNAELCTTISITVPQGDIAVMANTPVSLIVTNPPPADCASSTGIQVTIDAPPTVTSVAPSTVCEGGAQLTITGTNFLPGEMVELQCPGGVDLDAANVMVNADGTQISATFGPGAPAGQTCDVIVTNPDSCQDRPLPHKTVSVVTGPIAFDVDPDVVYNGINTTITIYATTLTQPIQSVELSMGGTVTSLTFSPVAGHPNRLQAVVPMGQAPGVYDLTLEDGLHCPTTLPNALTVTNTTTVTLAKVVPPFGYTAQDTAVEVFRDTTAAAPNDHPFVATPHVFLNAHGGGGTAVALESVAFLDGDHVTGVAPAGTPVGVYDVVLVNPDGTVGVLDSGYTETQNAPPEIDSATPSSIVDATGQKVTLAGRNFDPADVVTLSCVDAMGAAEPAPPVTSTAPACTAGSCTQAITIDGSALTVGSVCIARVTNTDGTYGEYSAIGVTNASLNLNAPQAGNDMNVGRRALAAASGNATPTDRFVYAIGGDDGMASGALSSVELAPVDIYGAIGQWTIQPNALPAARTLAGAVSVGRYIYLVGGDDGTGAVATAERAMILSPRETPVIDDVDLQLATTGLDAGAYHYRVSAVFSATDPDNPDGESLASDEQTVNVPSFPGKKVALTLLWKAPVDSLGNPLPNVVGYRIYRTAAGGAPGSETLLGTSTMTQFLDDGSAMRGAATPLPLGSTGTWASLPALGTAREGLAVAWARDPAAPGTFYVYALLGRSSPTTGLASYEYLPVTIGANGHQTAGAAWTPGATSSSQARWQLGAWTVDDTVSTSYATPYVFVGGGLTAAGAAAKTVEAGLVTAGGQLTFTSVNGFSTNDAGYGVCAANDQLFAFGGLNAGPSAGAQSATLTNTPPALAPGAWNNEGVMLVHGRYLMGSTVQSSFIFLLGGQTAGGSANNETSAASKTTELVIW